MPCTVPLLVMMACATEHPHRGTARYPWLTCSQNVQVCNQARELRAKAQGEDFNDDRDRSAMEQIALGNKMPQIRKRKRFTCSTARSDSMDCGE